MENLSIKTLFPSRFLRPSDLGDTDMLLTIARVSLEDFGSSGYKEQKAVVFFREIDKGFVLNKTNASSIAYLYGDNTAGWVDKRVLLFKTEVSYQGKQMEGIRVRMRPPSQLQMPETASPEPPEPPNPWA